MPVSSWFKKKRKAPEDAEGPSSREEETNETAAPAKRARLDDDANVDKNDSRDKSEDLEKKPAAIQTGKGESSEEMQKSSPKGPVDPEKSAADSPIHPAALAKETDASAKDTDATSPIRRDASAKETNDDSNGRNKMAVASTASKAAPSSSSPKKKAAKKKAPSSSPKKKAAKKKAPPTKRKLPSASQEIATDRKGAAKEQAGTPKKKAQTKGKLPSSAKATNSGSEDGDPGTVAAQKSPPTGAQQTPEFTKPPLPSLPKPANGPHYTRQECVDVLSSLPRNQRRKLIQEKIANKLVPVGTTQIYDVLARARKGEPFSDRMWGVKGRPRKLSDFQLVAIMDDLGRRSGDTSTNVRLDQEEFKRPTAIKMPISACKQTIRKYEKKLAHLTKVIGPMAGTPNFQNTANRDAAEDPKVAQTTPLARAKKKKVSDATTADADVVDTDRKCTTIQSVDTESGAVQQTSPDGRAVLAGPVDSNSPDATTAVFQIKPPGSTGRKSARKAKPLPPLPPLPAPANGPHYTKEELVSVVASIPKVGRGRAIREQIAHKLAPVSGTQIYDIIKKAKDGEPYAGKAWGARGRPRLLDDEQLVAIKADLERKKGGSFGDEEFITELEEVHRRPIIEKGRAPVMPSIIPCRTTFRNYTARLSKLKEVSASSKPASSVTGTRRTAEDEMISEILGDLAGDNNRGTDVQAVQETENDRIRAAIRAFDNEGGAAQPTAPGRQVAAANADPNPRNLITTALQVRARDIATVQVDLVSLPEPANGPYYSKPELALVLSSLPKKVRCTVVREKIAHKLVPVGYTQIYDIWKKARDGEPYADIPWGRPGRPKKAAGLAPRKKKTKLKREHDGPLILPDPENAPHYTKEELISVLSHIPPYKRGKAIKEKIAHKLVPVSHTVIYEMLKKAKAGEPYAQRPWGYRGRPRLLDDEQLVAIKADVERKNGKSAGKKEIMAEIEEVHRRPIIEKGRAPVLPSRIPSKATFRNYYARLSRMAEGGAVANGSASSESETETRDTKDEA